MAEVDENRTHQGRDTPRIGFEDREPHQRTNYLRNFTSGILRLLDVFFNIKFLVKNLINTLKLLMNQIDEPLSFHPLHKNHALLRAKQLLVH